MDADRIKAHAKALWADELTQLILTDMERAAVSIAVQAKQSDIETVQDALADARAVQRFRSKLRNLAADHEGDEE